MERLVHRYESHKEFEFVNWDGVTFLQRKVFFIHCENDEYQVRLRVYFKKYDAPSDKYIQRDAFSYVLPIEEFTQNSKCFYAVLPGNWLCTEKQNRFYETDAIELEHIVSAIEKDCETYVG